MNVHCGVDAVSAAGQLLRRHRALTLASMREDCIAFLRDNAADIGTAYDAAGYDFWMTHQRSGCGFDDGDWKPQELGRRLYDAAHEFGEVNLYVGDDGIVYAAGCEPRGYRSTRRT